jgi:hypothetical protein
MWRGPVRHPRAYRFFSLMGGANGEAWLVALIAWLFSGKQFERLLRKDAATDEYLGVCEIRHLQDEIERRLAQRKTGKA